MANPTGRWHRRFDRTAFLLLAALLAWACQAPNGQGARATLEEGPSQILVTGGTVVTFDEQSRVIEDGAVAIVDDRIVAIGTSTELAADYPDSERIDATGRIVMPGLINAHTHAPMVLFRGLADDLELMDWLENHIFPAEAQHVDEEFVRWGTRLACLEMLRGGTTTFVDMYYFEDAIAEETERCGMRAVLGQTVIDFPAPDNKTWEEAIESTRAFLEKWKGHPTITAAVAPHAPYTVSTDHLIETYRLAEEHDAPYLIHLVEDRKELRIVSESTGHTSIDLLDELEILDDRVVAAHVVWPSDGEIELLAERNVGVAHCPQSNMKIAAGVAPIPTLIEAGIAVGVGTDGAGSNNDLDLWGEVDTAAKLHKVFTQDPTALNAKQAISMATIEGAKALDMDDEIGSLEVGKRADLIIVATDKYHQQPQRASTSPYSLLVYSTKAADVETVLIDGRIVMRDGEVLTVDIPETVARSGGYRDAVAASP